MGNESSTVYVYNESLHQCVFNDYLLNIRAAVHKIGSINEYGREQDDLDSRDFRCFLTIVLVSIHSSMVVFYANVVLMLTIALISIFGKIRENYRWFILNQVFWDIFTLYEGICLDDHSKNFFEKLYCAHTEENSNGFHTLLLNYYFGTRRANDHYSALFSLAMSRFICLYYSNFYEKTTRGYRVACWILGINGFLIGTTISSVLQESRGDNYYELYGRKTFRSIVYNVSMAFCYLKGPLFMICTIVAVTLVFYRIVKHSKFQYHNKRKDFYSTLRILTVLFLQLVTNLFTFACEIQRNFHDFCTHAFGINVWLQYGNSSFGWFSDIWGFSDYGNYKIIRQIRVFFEAVIVLTIMTGYRESLIAFGRWVYYTIRRKPPPPKNDGPQGTISWVKSET